MQFKFLSLPVKICIKERDCAVSSTNIANSWYLPSASWIKSQHNKHLDINNVKHKDNREYHIYAGDTWVGGCRALTASACVIAICSYLCSRLTVTNCTIFHRDASQKSQRKPRRALLLKRDFPGISVRGSATRPANEFPRSVDWTAVCPSLNAAQRLWQATRNRRQGEDRRWHYSTPTG